MPKMISTRILWFALRASAALALAVAPYQINLHSSAKISPSAAYAKGDGGGGGSGGGEGHGGNSGSGGNSGRGGADDDHGDDHGADNAGHRDGQEHVNPQTGDKVEVAGNKIEVTHPDGTKEEIANGRFEQKDAAGRTVTERPATPEDAARLQGL